MHGPKDPPLQNQFGDFLLELGLLERAALNFIEADGVHQKFCAEEPEELTHIEFGDKHLLVALENVAKIGRQGVQMAQMYVADAVAEFALGFYSCGDGAMRRAPGDDEQVAVGIAPGNSIRNVLRDG